VTGVVGTAVTGVVVLGVGVVFIGAVFIGVVARAVGVPVGLVATPLPSLPEESPWEHAATPKVMPASRTEISRPRGKANALRAMSGFLPQIVAP
jgi:hypothetical protein